MIGQGKEGGKWRFFTEEERQYDSASGIETRENVTNRPARIWKKRRQSFIKDIWEFTLPQKRKKEREIFMAMAIYQLANFHHANLRKKKFHSSLAIHNLEREKKRKSHQFV